MSNLPQGSEAPVDLISQLQRNINSHILRDFHLRDVWWRPENQQHRKLKKLQNFARAMAIRAGSVPWFSSFEH
jgi:hypothetical protein